MKKLPKPKLKQVKKAEAMERLWKNNTIVGSKGKKNEDV